MLKNLKTKFNLSIVGKILKWGFFALLAMAGLLIIMVIYYTWDLPQPEKFTETPFIQSTKIYDRTGQVLLYDIYGEEKREVVSFDQISDNLKHSVLASEDSRFYQHGGVDVLGILRALWVDIKSQSKSQGGSTITQQLVRSVYLTGQKSISRKIKEAVLSIELEARYSKDQILDWYLNQIPFGENAYGAESASQTYFNKHASELTIAEAALLTAIIPAPSYYSPYGSHQDELYAKKDAILDRMQKLGYITQEELEQAKNEEFKLAESTISIKAPNLVMYVTKYLYDKYGEDYLKEKGLRVYTTLDYDLQQYAEQIVEDADQTNISKGANNTAMVAIDPKTGEILALMGSKDYFAKAYPETGSVLFAPKYDVATLALRQPGSAFKPIVYAAAFKKGYTPNTVLWDVRTEFNTSCNPNGYDAYGSDWSACYHPQNYDGSQHGPVTLRSSLAGSLNIPSVKVLYLAGIDDTIQTAKDFGITTLTDTKNYGLSLVLGGGAVNLMELTSAYGVFATEGSYTPPVGILKITDINGNVIEETKPQTRKVLDTQIARQISDVLSDNGARSFIFGANSALYVPGYQVAVKTGTTQNLIDGWTIGYTPSVVIGFWTGNNDNSPTKDIGVGITAPMWNKVMTKYVSTHEAETFTAPDPITDRNPVLLGQMPTGDTNTILYYINKNNPTGPAQQGLTNDPQYPFWQIGINNWLLATMPPEYTQSIAPAQNQTTP
jgi:1A family penicillin-binding protein